MLFSGLGSLPLSHLSTDILVDVPDEGEAAPGAQSSDQGEAQNHQLNALDGAGSLIQTCVCSSGVIADSSDDQDREEAMVEPRRRDREKKP